MDEESKFATTWSTGLHTRGMANNDSFYSISWVDTFSEHRAQQYYPLRRYNTIIIEPPCCLPLQKTPEEFGSISKISSSIEGKEDNQHHFKRNERGSSAAGDDNKDMSNFITSTCPPPEYQSEQNNISYNLESQLCCHGSSRWPWNRELLLQVTHVQKARMTTNNVYLRKHNLESLTNYSRS